MHKKSKQSVASGKAEFAAAFALSAQVRSDGSSHRVVSAEEQADQNLKINISSTKAASAPRFVHKNSGGNGSNSEVGGFEQHLGYNYTGAPSADSIGLAEDVTRGKNRPVQSSAIAGDGARRSTIPTKKVDQAWALMSEHSNAAERTPFANIFEEHNGAKERNSSAHSQGIDAKRKIAALENWRQADRSIAAERAAFAKDFMKGRQLPHTDPEAGGMKETTVRKGVIMTEASTKAKHSTSVQGAASEVDIVDEGKEVHKSSSRSGDAEDMHGRHFGHDLTSGREAYAKGLDFTAAGKQSQVTSSALSEELVQEELEAERTTANAKDNAKFRNRSNAKDHTKSAPGKHKAVIGSDMVNNFEKWHGRKVEVESLVHRPHHERAHAKVQRSKKARRVPAYAYWSMRNRRKRAKKFIWR